MIWKFLKQNVLFPKGLNWVQHWVRRLGLFYHWPRSYNVWHEPGNKSEGIYYIKYDEWNVDVKYNMTVFAPWCGILRSSVSLRGHLLLCCRKYNLRLKSSDYTRQTGGKSVFQRKGLWLLAGTSALTFAAFNRLWERKQRRKLRVHVEGIGRFFRWCTSHTMNFEKFSLVPHFLRKRIHYNHHASSWSLGSTFLKRCDQIVHHHSLENEHE